MKLVAHLLLAGLLRASVHERTEATFRTPCASFYVCGVFFFFSLSLSSVHVCTGNARVVLKGLCQSVCECHILRSTRYYVSVF